ncbi:E3 ubiquitin-protein ligase parkin-like [Haliotis asinina]|uniref:E3 ubiquitin-protein ligase parkin-like n=1 Tax=Haliotis asinina TaxID=109174 RepID=UPI003531D040
MITVNVKFHSNCAVLVEINPDSSLSEIKREISKKVNLPLEEVRIIFGGKLLTDDCEFQDLDIGDQSTLHIFRQISGNEKTRPSGVNEERELKNQYYVYCKECRSIQPGKLRVKCAMCQDGAFVLSRDPEGWSDVLQSRCMGGECRNDGCEGTAAEFVFKCGKSHPDGISAAVLRHVRPNRREVECITCADVRSPVLVFPCESGHVMCIECFRVYGITQLSERRFIKHPEYGYTLPCPAGCPSSEIQESHHFHLLGDEQYERFNTFAAEEYVLQDGGVLCPGPGCGMGFVLDTAGRKVTCVAKDCMMTFCRDCKNEYHEGPCDDNPLLRLSAQDYSVDPFQADRSRWEDQSRTLIDRTTKPCPKCGTRTERNGGCMHMLCPRCGEDWCWVCNKVWDRDCQGQHWFG